MKRVACLSALLVAIALPASAQKVYIDYDSSVDFSALETFSWRETGQPSLKDSDPLLHQYIVDSIVGRLTAAGLEQVEDDPDFFVTYHGESDTEYQVDTTTHGYGFGRGWRWGGVGRYGPSTSTVRSYDRGTLIIDAWDGGREELIWRGSATTTWSENPTKARKKIDKMIAKIVKKWDKEYRQGR